MQWLVSYDIYIEGFHTVDHSPGFLSRVLLKSLEEFCACLSQSRGDFHDSAEARFSCCGRLN